MVDIALADRSAPSADSSLFRQRQLSSHTDRVSFCPQAEPNGLRRVECSMPSRILYFRGGILEDVEEFAAEDLVEAARTASSHHPQLTAEIWQRGRKAAVIRPCCEQRYHHMLPQQFERRAKGAAGQAKR